MTLAEYIHAKGIKPPTFAADIGVAPMTVYRWCNGGWPSRANMAAITRITAGAVTAADFMPPDTDAAA